MKKKNMTWSVEVLTEKLGTIRTRLQECSHDYPSTEVVAQKELAARLGQLQRLARDGWNTAAVRRLLGEAARDLSDEVNELRYQLARSGGR